MSDPFVIFWCALVVASIAWYAFLVFYVGIKAGHDIRAMTKSLEAAAARARSGTTVVAATGTPARATADARPAPARNAS